MEFKGDLSAINIAPELSWEEKFIRFADKAFRLEYTPEVLGSLIGAVFSLNNREVPNIWLKSKNNMETILAPVRKRMAKKQSKEQFTIISSLTSALLTVMKQLRQYKQESSYQAFLKNSSDLDECRRQKKVILSHMKQKETQIMSCKYWLVGINELLKDLKPISLISPQYFTKIQQFSSFVEKIQREDQKNFGEEDSYAYANELSYNQVIFECEPTPVGIISGKRKITIFEQKIQKLQEVLDDFLPTCC